MTRNESTQGNYQVLVRVSSW